MKPQRRVLVLTAATASITLGLLGCSEQSVETSAAPKTSTVTEPDSVERDIPEVCTSLNLAVGAQLDGGPLGDCVAQALASFGSGKMQIAGDSVGEFEFTYEPDFNVQGELQSPTGVTKVALVGTEMWVDTGGGPVKGDPNSENPEELMAALAGELTRQYADLTQTALLIQAQPVWHIDDSKSAVTLPNGEEAEGYRIVSAGSFEWNGVPVTEFVVWFGDDWVPLATQASMSMMGVNSTNSQSFYALGEPVTIRPLG